MKIKITNMSENQQEKMEFSKIKVFPNFEQVRWMSKCFGVYRRAYNIAVKLYIEKASEDSKTVLGKEIWEMAMNLNSRGQVQTAVEKELSKRLRFRIARREIATKIEMDTEAEWVHEIPMSIRESGIRDLDRLMHTGKRSRGMYVYRSREDNTQTFQIRPDDWRQLTILHNMSSTQPLPKEVSHPVRVKLNTQNEYFLYFKN